MRRIDRTVARTYDHEGASRWRAPTRTAPSFNGRTADSGSAYRGSNPWGATKTSTSPHSLEPSRLSSNEHKSLIIRNMLRILRPCKFVEVRPQPRVRLRVH